MMHCTCFEIASFQSEQNEGIGFSRRRGEVAEKEFSTMILAYGDKNFGDELKEKSFPSA